MSIYLLETWIIKPEDEAEHRLIWKRYLDYMKSNPGLFANIESMKISRRVSGNNLATHAQIVEFDSMENKRSLDSRLSEDSESLEFHRKLMRIKDAATTEEMLCEPFLEYG